MHRRQFLTAAAAAGAGVAFAREATVFPIIDTHQHLWDLDRFTLHWLKTAPKLARSYGFTDYRAATADLGTFPTKEGPAPGKVVKTVYMEVDVAPEQQAAEADYVLGVCRKGDTPMAAAVISGRPAAPGFRAYITRYKDSKYIKGVRQVLHNPGNPAGYCLRPDFIKGIRLLGELGMSYDLCLRPGELEDGARLIDACPDTRFILDHCGNADVQARDRSAWQRGMDAVGRRKHAVCKVSGIVASAKPGAWSADDLAPIVRHTVEAFGKDRVMFGGDWPVCTLAATYKQWVEALKTIVHDWSDEDRRKLFHDNAAKFYGLA